MFVPSGTCKNLEFVLNSALQILPIGKAADRLTNKQTGREWNKKTICLWSVRGINRPNLSVYIPENKWKWGFSSIMKPSEYV